MQFTWDSRWVSLLAWVGLTINGLAADQLAQFALRVSATLGCGCTLNVQDGGVTGFSSQVVWSPPPQLASITEVNATQPNCRVVLNNTDGDSYQVDAVLYNFKKDVRQRIPLNSILSNLPRGTTAT